MLDKAECKLNENPIKCYFHLKQIFIPMITGTGITAEFAGQNNQMRIYPRFFENAGLILTQL